MSDRIFKIRDQCYSTQHIYHYANVEEWLELLERNEPKVSVEAGRRPSYEFMEIRDLNDKIIGMINVRYDLSDEMLMYLGHIGY